MHTFLVVLQVLVAIGVIGLVLIQHGKGADAGAAFGSGASGTVFGARGAANFLSRLTAGLALVFFLSSLALAYWVGGRSSAPTSVVDSVQQAPLNGEPVPAAAPAEQPSVDPSQPAPVEQPKVPE